MHPISLYCTAILGALVFLLGLFVSIQRFRNKLGSGQAEERNALINRVIRAHGNTTEFAPFLAILFLYLGSHNPSSLVLGLIFVATLCRCLIVAGLIGYANMNRPNPLRFTGALGTYLAGAGLCLALVMGG